MLGYLSLVAPPPTGGVPGCAWNDERVQSPRHVPLRPMSVCEFKCVYACLQVWLSVSCVEAPGTELTEDFASKQGWWDAEGIGCRGCAWMSVSHILEPSW